MANERIFSAVNTKIRILKSNLLGDSDYLKLMNKEDLIEQVKYLNENTIYKIDFESIGDMKSIQNIESVLRNYMIGQHRKILNFFTDDYRSLFETLLLKYDIDFLKTYVRILGTKDDSSKINKYRLVNERYRSFDLDKVMKASNIDELIDSLDGTIYYNTLRTYKNQKDRRLTFYIDMNLEKLYFNLLYTKSKLLSKKDAGLFQEILGVNEDLLNLQWIYRGIKFFELLPEELINFTLPHGLIFKYNDLKSISYGNENELMEKVISTQYKFLFDSERDIDLYMNRRIHRYLYYMFLKLLKSSGMDITLAIAYIHLLDYEVGDIVSILEAKRYGLDIPEIKEHLIRNLERRQS